MPQCMLPASAWCRNTCSLHSHPCSWKNGKLKGNQLETNGCLSPGAVLTEDQLQIPVECLTIRPQRKKNFCFLNLASCIHHLLHSSMCYLFFFVHLPKWHTFTIFIHLWEHLDPYIKIKIKKQKRLGSIHENKNKKQTRIGWIILEILEKWETVCFGRKELKTPFLENRWCILCNVISWLVVLNITWRKKSLLISLHPAGAWIWEPSLAWRSGVMHCGRMGRTIED